MILKNLKKKFYPGVSAGGQALHSSKVHGLNKEQ